MIRSVNNSKIESDNKKIRSFFENPKKNFLGVLQSGVCVKIFKFLPSNADLERIWSHRGYKRINKDCIPERNKDKDYILIRNKNKDYVIIRDKDYEHYVLMWNLFETALGKIKDMGIKKLRKNEVLKLIFQNELESYEFRDLSKKADMVMKNNLFFLEEKMEEKFGKNSLSEKRIEEIFYYDSLVNFIAVLSYLNGQLFIIQKKGGLTTIEDCKQLRFEYWDFYFPKDVTMFKLDKIITKESLYEFFLANGFFLEEDFQNVLGNDGIKDKKYLSKKYLEFLKEIKDTLGLAEKYLNNLLEIDNYLKSIQDLKEIKIFLNKLGQFDGRNEKKDKYYEKVYEIKEKSFNLFYEFFQKFYSKLKKNNVEEKVFYKITNDVLFECLLRLMDSNLRRVFELNSKKVNNLQQTQGIVGQVIINNMKKFL